MNGSRRAVPSYVYSTFTVVRRSPLPSEQTSRRFQTVFGGAKADTLCCAFGAMRPLLLSLTTSQFHELPSLEKVRG
jgi:hypothetical protein